MPHAGRVHRLGAREAVDRVGDEALVPESARAFELPLARAAPRFVDDACVRRCSVRVPEERSGARDAVPEEDVGRGRPFLAEDLLDPGDRPADRRHDREALLRVADRELEHVGEPPGAEFAQHQQPSVESTRDDGGQEARARDEVEVELAEALDRRCRRRCPLAADDQHLVAVGGVDDRRQVAGRAVQVRLDDLEHEAGGDGRVEGVAAPFEDGHAGRGSEPVRRGDHAEGAAELGSRREPHGEGL